MPYISLPRAEVYHEVVGSGEPVVLLHGGFCSLETMRPQLECLATRYRVHAMERPGHGRSVDREGPFTYDDIVADTVDYLDALGLEDAHVLGFSDGGIAALMLAIDYPDRVRSLVAIGSNTDPEGLIDEAEGVGSKSGLPDASGDSTSLVRRIEEQMQTDYEQLSPDGPVHAELVREKLARLWQDEPHIPLGDLRQVKCPALIMAGDADSIRIEHTVAIAKNIRGAQLCIVPGATHLVMMERPDLVNTIVVDFLVGADASPSRCANPAPNTN
ncbi:alpha/beta hydrolase [Planctomonas sp. JC2975]|uniref:alpha/beta fold hydrolase n=1 Tax=Planctomonas sp. JC2975 TaxID=2729626 RepID=UPI00147653F3|nr:alpha/beta hydrolase [Planctomonas sp. JC2975]NNC13645.1 alpha/beta hydrolase [Planctomonas sp. JC2975]